MNKARAWNAELERLTIGRLKRGLSQWIPGTCVLDRDQPVYWVSRLFTSSLLVYFLFFFQSGHLHITCFKRWQLYSETTMNDP